MSNITILSDKVINSDIVSDKVLNLDVINNSGLSLTIGNSSTIVLGIEQSSKNIIDVSTIELSLIIENKSPIELKVELSNTPVNLELNLIKGLKGDTGLKGDAGLKGDTGLKGDAGSGWYQQDITLTSQDIINKYILLDYVVIKPTSLEFLIFSGIEQRPLHDFGIINNKVFWENLALEYLLEENMSIAIRYNIL